MAYIIVIEGTDGSGKQTQTNELCKMLESSGYNVLRQSFPNYESPACTPVKMYLGGEFGDSADCLDPYQASILFSVDRLCTFKKSIEEFYKTDGVIVFDRYMQSNMLHQAGKLKSHEEIDEFVDWLYELEINKLGLPKADKVIFLDVPLSVSKKLIEERGIHKSNTKKDVHEGDFEHLTKAYNAGKYVADKCGWTVIDCTQNDKMKSIEEISYVIWNEVSKDIKR